MTCNTNTTTMHSARQENIPDTCSLIFLLFISAVLVAESVFTIHINMTCKRVRRLPFTKLVSNLAVSGGVMGLSVGCYSLYALAATTTTQTADSYVIGTLRHGLFIVLPLILHVVSVLGLCCLTLDRYVAICHPLRYRYILTPLRYRGLVAASWCVPALVLVTGVTLSELYCEERFAVIPYLVLFLVATVIVMVMYFRLALEFRGRGSEHPNDILRRTRYKTSRDVLVIIVLNVILAIPHTLVMFSFLVSSKWHMRHFILHYLLLIHQVLFLPMYAYRNADFRSALMERSAAIKIKCCSPEEYQLHSTTALFFLTPTLTDLPPSPPSPVQCISFNRV